MSERLAYDFGEIETVVHRQIQATAARFNTVLADLRHQIAPLQQSWTRQAGDAYRGEQDRWDRAAAALNQILGELAAAVRHGSAVVADADHRAALAWLRGR